MAALDESTLPERLAEQDEEEWARLRVTLEYATGFWLAFVFAPSSLDAAVFRRRISETLVSEGSGRMDVFLPQSPEELREVLPWLLSQDRADAQCVWVQALQVDAGGHEAGPWTEAWTQVFLRANERREALRRRLNGGLVFVSPPHMKAIVQQAAPDLWSIRSIVLELSGKTIATRGQLDVVAEEMRLMTEPRLQTTAPDAVFWMAEANRRAPGTEGRAAALEQAARGWVNEGRFAEALAAMLGAVDIYRKLAEERPDAFLPGLARSLNNLGICYRNLDQREAAVASTLEAVGIRRKLADRDPNAFLPGLARNLYNLGIDQGALGQREAALASTQEAVVFYRKLAAQQPDVFLPELGTTLNNLGIDQGALGQHERALASMQEAVNIRRTLVERNVNAFVPNLAKSLHNLGIRQAALGQREAALASTQEAVEILRKLVERNPDVILPDLAMSLGLLALQLSKSERNADALPYAHEALEIFFRFHERFPLAFERYVRMTVDVVRQVHEALRTPLDEATQRRIEAFEDAARPLSDQTPPASNAPTQPPSFPTH